MSQFELHRDVERDRLPLDEFTLISSLLAEPSVAPCVSTSVCMNVGYSLIAVVSGLRR